MAFREVAMLAIKEVLRRWLRRATKSEIARQCGVARGTVRGYIRAAEEEGLAPGQDESVLDEERLVALAARLHPSNGRPRGDGWQQCQEHGEFISKLLKREVRLTKVRKLLRRRKCVVVSYATLRRFAIEQLGYGSGRSTMPVADGEPGKELQARHRLGRVAQARPDGAATAFPGLDFHAGCLALPLRLPVFRETTETAIEACEAAWEFYGGVFDVLIPDNPKCLVQKADPLEPTINLTFLEYTQSRGL
jgi:transposase